MTPRVAVLSTGGELMRGRGVDTHLGTLARALEPLGLEISFHATCGDDFARLVDEIKLAAARADVVIMTGGLGPTEDDLTRTAVEEAFHRPLRFRTDLWRAVQARFRRFHIPMAAINRRQGFLPEGAAAFPNPHGSAPGFSLAAEGVLFFALPGPPREMIPMLERRVLPRLARAFPRVPRFAIWEGRTVGLPEGTVDEIVAPVVRRVRGATYGTHVSPGYVGIRVRGRSAAVAARTAGLLRGALGRHLLDGASLEADVAALAAKRKVTLAVAESCTGGLVAHRLTEVPGISANLLEAVVAYSNAAKTARLGVSESLLRRHGAVSAEAAAAMAEGVARTAGADLGMSTTGIAGPTGAVPGKPVGLVHHAVHFRGRTRVERRVHPGARPQVKARAANLVLDMARMALMD